MTYLRETEQQMHMAAQSEQEANDATQDILHRLELCDIDGETAETLALKLQAVRRQRRKAKDVLDQAILISEWMESHRPMVKELERLLGEVRKQERKSQNRIYTPRTGILEEESYGATDI